MEQSRQRREHQRPQGGRWPRRPAWCWPTSAASRVKTDTGAAPRVPRQRLPVPGRQEHPARHGRQGDARWRGSRSCSSGPTAIAYSFEDPAAPAKVATKVAKGEEKFVIKGGYVDGKALDVKGVEALSNLPGKDELRATFLATLLAVPQNFLRLTTAAPQNFAYLLAARERALARRRSAAEVAASTAWVSQTAVRIFVLQHQK